MRQRTSLTAPVFQNGHPPRIARILALAHKLDGLVMNGTVRDYAELDPIGHISPASLSQILTLLHLAPDIREQLLFAEAEAGSQVTEQALRKIAREPRWKRRDQQFLTSR